MKDSFAYSIGEQVAIALAEKGYEAVNYACRFVCETDAYVMGGYTFPKCSTSLMEFFNDLTMKDMDEASDECGELRYYMVGFLVKGLVAGLNEEGIRAMLADAYRNAPTAIKRCERAPRLGNKEEFDEESMFLRNNFHRPRTYNSRHHETDHTDWWER